MLEKTRKRRHRSSHSDSETAPMVEPSIRSRSRSAPKRLLIPVWLLVISNCILLIVFMTDMGSRDQSTTDRQDHIRTASKTIYQKAIEDAAYVGHDRVTHQLQPIEKNYLLKWEEFEGESWVKVLLWTSNSDFDKRFATFAGSDVQRMPDELPTEFVTLVPQVKDFCQRLINDDQFQVDYRLKQYLGLNPNQRHDKMVELWVPPRELFRPCPDPETHDRFCELDTPRDPVSVANIDDYSAFLKQLSIDSYHRSGRPWTRLGYTYDWANGERGVGASEYMLVPRARFRVAGSFSTDEYCQ